MKANAELITHDEARNAAMTLALYTHAQMTSVLESITRNTTYAKLDDGSDSAMRARYGVIRHYRREAALVARLLEHAR